MLTQNQMWKSILYNNFAVRRNNINGRASQADIFYVTEIVLSIMEFNILRYSPFHVNLRLIKIQIGEKYK